MTDAPELHEDGPELGAVMSLCPGHRAVFRGEWCMGIPVYETEIPEPLPFSEFPTLLMKVERPASAGAVLWNV